jgi:hypothetical protein
MYERLAVLRELWPFWSPPIFRPMTAHQLREIDEATEHRRYLARLRVELEAMMAAHDAEKARDDQ